MSITIKIIAIGVIFLGFCYLSVCIDKKYKQRYNSLLVLDLLVTDMNKRIQNYPIKLSEIAFAYADVKYHPYDKVFAELKDKLDNTSCDSFENIYKKAIDSNIDDKEIITLLNMTFSSLCINERENISALVDIALENIKKAENEAKENIKNKGALYAKLTRLAGILTVILLI